MANSREEGQKQSRKQIRHRHHYRQRVVTDFTRATEYPKLHKMLQDLRATSELHLHRIDNFQCKRNFLFRRVRPRHHSPPCCSSSSFRKYSSPGPDERCSRMNHGVGTSYMIPMVYRYIDSYTALFLLLVYRGTWLTQVLGLLQCLGLPVCLGLVIYRYTIRIIYELPTVLGRCPADQNLEVSRYDSGYEIGR